MKTTALVIALTAGVALAGSAQARDGRDARGPMPMPTFAQLDINADGAVSLDEIETAMATAEAARFAEMDANGDGGLSADEMMAQADADRESRMENRIARRIETADTNGDGLLQAEEIAAQRQDSRRGPGPERMFQRVDADDNGSLSVEEYAAAMARLQDRGDRGPRHNN